MTCKQCKYHSYIADTHFCDSRNHKRRTVRISREDAEKDIVCYWADEEGEKNESKTEVQEIQAAYRNT